MIKKLFNLTNRTSNGVLGCTIVIVLAAINVEIIAKEKIINDGTTMLLQLAPRDPRSLLQGDYMTLNYAMANNINRDAIALAENDGAIVVLLDETNEANFVGVYDGAPLAEGQHLLQYRKRGEVVRLASDAFFFEEGAQKRYQGARYGEFRVDTKGGAVLIGLRGQNKESL